MSASPRTAAFLGLPLRALPEGAESVLAFIYNEASDDWDPAFPPAGSGGLRVDRRARTVSFEAQVFGVYAVAATSPGWTPRAAIRHRYHKPW